MANDLKTLTRTVHLSVLPNFGKSECLRYTSKRFARYCQHWLTQLYFSDKSHLSTAGMGQLANQAQHKAIGILKAHREATKATGKKSNVPQVGFLSCPGKIESSKKTSFDFWVGFEDPFSKKRIRIPAKSHKRLNYWIKKGWDINPACEIAQTKTGRWHVRVFIQKEIESAKPAQKSLGVDVGINHCVSRSDGYLGRSARKILTRTRNRDAERRRQGHQRSLPKSNFKQQLNIEARRAVARCKRDGLNLIVEDPKVLANLRPSLQWARSYFANRCLILGQEEKVFVLGIFPAWTSQSCYKCGHRAKASRLKSTFKCVGCGSSTRADINAARVIGQKGSAEIRCRLKSEVA